MNSHQHEYVDVNPGRGKDGEQVSVHLYVNGNVTANIEVCFCLHVLVNIYDNESVHPQFVLVNVPEYIHAFAFWHMH